MVNSSANITFSKSSTSGFTAKCMPDGAIYWYGNFCETMSGGWKILTQQQASSVVTFSNNAFTLTTSHIQNNSIIYGTTNAIESGTISAYITYYMQGSGATYDTCNYFEVEYTGSSSTNTQISETGVISKTTTKSGAVAFQSYAGGSITISAVWYE